MGDNETKNVSLNPEAARRFCYEMRSFIGARTKTTQIIVVDLETNGIRATNSVLSCSAIKYSLDALNFIMTETGRFNRYYYPRSGNFDEEARIVHGLNREKITQLRAGSDYPEHFIDDVGLTEFSKSVKKFVSHNTAFDMKFIEGKLAEESIRTFCTMNSNRNIICIPLQNDIYDDDNDDDDESPLDALGINIMINGKPFQKPAKRTSYKAPTLKETAGFYEIEYDDKMAHNSMKDTEITAAIFKEMFAGMYRSLKDAIS